MPGLALRTTLISGFPGETDAAHEELVDFVRETGFEALGVFPYSPEPGTPAARMHAEGGAIDPGCVEQRIEQLMLTQQQIVFDRNAEMARRGDEIVVLVDGPDADAEEDTTVAVGRTSRQAPEIDIEAQYCPACNVPTIRSEGCNHIICVCGEEWTWEGGDY